MNPAIQQNIIYHDQLGFILGMQNCYNICKSVNDTSHKWNERQKSHDHKNRCSKTIWSIQHLFMIKALSKVGREGMYLSIIKAIYNTYCQPYTQRAKTKSFSLDIRNKTGVSTFTTLIQHTTGSTSHSGQTRRRNKRHPKWRGGNETVIICRWHDIVHRKSYRLHQKLFDLINEFGKVAGYKVNIQKSMAFLHTNNEISERKTKKTMPFTLATKNNSKVPRNKFNQGGKNTCTQKSIRTLKKGIEEDTNKWKHKPYL